MAIQEKPLPGTVTHKARAFATLNDLMRLKHRAQGFSFLPRQPVHSLLSGRHASRLRGRGLNFEELRHYSDGDDTRSIDWRATARSGTPFVRVYSEERDRPVLLIIDQRSCMFFGSRRMMKSVAAAELAALAAWRVTSLGDRVGALIISDHEITRISPRARDAGVMRILPEVIRYNNRLCSNSQHSASADSQLNLALEQAVRLAKHDWLICLISDMSGEDTQTSQLVTRLTAHNDLLAAYIYDPLEHELPDVGPAAFSSGNDELTADLSSSSLRRRFKEKKAEWRAHLASLSRKRAIPVLPVSTSRDVAMQLGELIGRRSAARFSGVGSAP